MATRNDLERMLSDESEEPKALPLSLLADITNSFSDDQEIGRGGFAVVYKGLLKNRFVAVKRLVNSYMHEKEFLQESECLMKAKHKNVVRFLGYCADTQGNFQRHDGKFVKVDVEQRLLCFEYVPMGNLCNYITDASQGLKWRKRYEIIKGICEGLNYLHQNHILHSDLKPANILMDNNMVPKIADFGISRCFGENQSGFTVTSSAKGTLGYLAPECFIGKGGKITFKSDIYSLGVVISEIVTGEKGYTGDEKLIEIWRNRLEKSKELSQLEQVIECAKIAIDCTVSNPGERPSTQLIMDRIAKTKSTGWSIQTAVSSSVAQGEKASNELHQGYGRNNQQLPDQDNTASQHQIPEEIEQLDTKLEQLQDGLSKLKTTMPKMLDLIDRVEWQSHKKKAADLLPDIKDAVYDAEDLLDEVDYYTLKLKVECSKNSGQDHLHDTCLKFLANVGSNDYIREVNRIQAKLDHVHRQSMDMGLHQAPLKFDKSVRPETSSYYREPEIFGRKDELKVLVETLGVGARKKVISESKEKMTELPVLAIVGMAGVGKTTMAQQISNDSEVKQHFDRIIWTCVSDDFDIKRLTKEIIEALGEDTSSNSLDVLMKKLQERIKSKRFLLVLDDMWDDILEQDGAGWKKFCEPLKYGVQGSRILVTTRSPGVANLVSPTNHYELEGLHDAVFWDFFKFCAFGSTSSCINRESLECIGKNILRKLKGSPLAAKTIGRLLRMDLSTTHWENIMESELWQLEQTETDILPALRLSYMYLPQKLKRCFSICAMFPKDHQFEKGFLADIWIAQGYAVESREASLCFNALANRSFFQKASPHSNNYVIHDLMHDTAQLVSKDECFIIKHAHDLDKVPTNVRHLSIFANGNVECSELKSICNKRKLRSLVCDESYSSAKDFTPMINCWFKQLLKIRVLSFKVSNVRQLPESMGNSKHLRHLCLLGHCTFSTLPSSVCRLYHLKTIDAGDCLFERFPTGFSDAISLQKINSLNIDYNKDHSDKLCLKWYSQSQMINNQMEVLPHWNLRHLHVQGYKGGSCPAWLRATLLPRLHSLEFHGCDNIKSMPFFVPSEGSHTTGSDNFNRLEALVIKHCGQIDWQGSLVLPTSLRMLDLKRSGYSMDYFVSCFLGLSSLTSIKIELCRSLTCIPLHVWSSNLPSLEELHIIACYSLTSVGVSGASNSDGVKGFSSLAKIHIRACHALLSLDELLTPDYLPVVKTIYIESCGQLASMSVDMLDGLQALDISHCPKLNSQRVMTFPSSLKKLRLFTCEVIQSIDIKNSPLGSSTSLEELSIMNCPGLRSINAGATAVNEIKSVEMGDCPKLSVFKELDDKEKSSFINKHPENQETTEEMKKIIQKHQKMVLPHVEKNSGLIVHVSFP